MTHSIKKKSSSNQQKQGEKFEEDFCEFLKLFIPKCFNITTFINKPTRQQAGYQYGRDISTKWKFKKSTFDWWFECKSHKFGKKRPKHINKKAVADKILDILTCPNPPSCFCIVSINKEVDNWLREIIERVNNLGRTQVFVWSPNTLNLKECIALYPIIWEKIYNNEKKPDFLPDKERSLFETIRQEFVEYNKKGIRNIEVLSRGEGQNRAEKKVFNLNDAEEIENIITQLKELKRSKSSS